jgi:hypothetical protein
VLTFAALDSAGKVDNWISGRADLRLSILSGVCSQFPVDLGICVRIRSGADGHDGDGDGDCDGDGDGTEST